MVAIQRHSVGTVYRWNDGRTEMRRRRGQWLCRGGGGESVEGKQGFDPSLLPSSQPQPNSPTGRAIEMRGSSPSYTEALDDVELIELDDLTRQGAFWRGLIPSSRSSSITLNLPHASQHTHLTHARSTVSGSIDRLPKSSTQPTRDRRRTIERDWKHWEQIQT
jgi:hypothetical protein